MGWMYTEKSRRESVKDFFQREFNKEIVACKVVKLRTAYMAVKLDNNMVMGLVCLLDYKHNDIYNFGYKDMSEDMGPCYYECPKDVLEKLSPLDQLFDSESNAYTYAKEWRERCWQYANRKKLSLKAGMRLKFENSFKFTNGYEFAEFTVTNPKRLFFRAHPDVNSGSRYSPEVRIDRKTINQAYNAGTVIVTEPEEAVF